MWIDITLVEEEEEVADEEDEEEEDCSPPAEPDESHLFIIGVDGIAICCI